MVRTLPLKSSKFDLDVSGVAGFFGGDEAVSAMGAVHMRAGRRWLGWYNAPGSYEIVRKYGQLARGRFWDGLFPGPNVEPKELFELDGKKGPCYKAWHSGTSINETGHIANLLLEESKGLESKTVEGRVTVTHSIAIVDLPTDPEPPCELDLKSLRSHSSLIAAIPILTSVAACAVCAVFKDWYSFSMILLGIICSGVSCFIIGSGKVKFTHPKPAEGSPKGDGVLMQGTAVVVLRGSEGAVNSVTRGKFSFKFTKWFRRTPKEHEEFRSFGICSLLLIAQFLAQLLLIIPQGELFGQIMFLASLGVSWGYHLYLSSIDKGVIQRRILMEHVLGKPNMTKFSFGTRTTMAVFLALMFDKSFDGNRGPMNDHKKRIEKCLSEIISNDTDE